jgi:DnaK suppressor protein
MPEEKKKKKSNTLPTLFPEMTPYKIKKGEAYMSEKQRDHFKHILQNKRKELMEEVDHTIHEMKTIDVPPDPNDRATQEETFSLELKTRDRERRLIRKIEKTLQQIEDKEYGFCDTCEEEIGIRRLEARPTANQCIECKTLAEVREKRTVL